MHVDAVLQSQITEQQQPNVVISPISNSTVVEIKQAVIEQPKEEVVAAPVDDDAAKPSESTGDNATAGQQPTTGTNTTETPTPPKPRPVLPVKAELPPGLLTPAPPATLTPAAAPAPPFPNTKLKSPQPDTNTSAPGFRPPATRKHTPQKARFAQPRCCAALTDIQYACGGAPRLCTKRALFRCEAVLPK